MTCLSIYLWVGWAFVALQASVAVAGRLNSCGLLALAHLGFGCVGTLVAPWHVESPQSRDRTCILCTGWWILIHSLTRAVRALSDWWQKLEESTAQPWLCTIVTLDRLDGPEEEVEGKELSTEWPRANHFISPSPVSVSINQSSHSCRATSQRLMMWDAPREMAHIHY